MRTEKKHRKPKVKFLNPVIQNNDGSAIEKIRYDFVRKELYVKLRLNNAFIYYNIEKEEFYEFMQQENKTAYLNTFHQGNHNYEIVDENKLKVLN